MSSLPIPEKTYSDIGIRSQLDSLSQRAHEIAKEMANGDRDVLRIVDSLVGNNFVPFAHFPQSDLSGYLAEIDIASSQVSETGELTSSKLGIIKGHPAVLQYILVKAALEGKEELSKAAIENFPVPKDLGACVAALEKMDLWAQRKPTLSQKLEQVQAEIDDLVLSAFTILGATERQHIKDRVKELTLSQVLVADEPGVPTKRIGIKPWKTRERYRS